MTTIEGRQLLEQVTVADGVARWSRNGTVRELPIKPLPERFIDWQHSQLFTRVADYSDRADPNLPVDPDPLFPLVR